ncbi:hypothetical protein EDD58_101669 [Hazenella coriacea]|uniref:Uncharacterized protein n=2 Tax=Hazenella coriacea TaxID=1179467 RepID=A0A4R3LBB8_9BACL|nr:hypothetical protein EDD58_101669 [Hazenella coriacea]
MLSVLLSACSQPASTDQKETTTDIKTSNSEAQESSSNEKKPEYLPDDFPLPTDAEITTSQSNMEDGKKSALLIFKTKASMTDVTKMYKEYFKTQNLSDDAQTFDDKNIIIQGINEHKKHDWSIIGGSLSSQDGIIEFQVTWAEL